ncbi:MAG: META domain-containing protein [Anaerolineae bacterium]|jgi:heat shock protein HslJ
MRKYDRMRRAIILMAAWLLLTACGSPATPVPDTSTPKPPATATAVPSIPLEGTEWILHSLRGEAPVAGASPTLAFYPENYMEGSTGCNSYGADYTASGPSFHTAQIHRTEFNCEEPAGIMPQDEAFFQALAGIDRYQATEARLAFDNAAGETVLIYTRKRLPVVDPALQGTEWLLASLRGGDLLDGSRITLNLDAEEFGGYAGCNNYGGEYEAADGGRLIPSYIAHTEMDCPSPTGIMEQEMAYLQALNSATTYRLVENRLEVSDASDATILVFVRKDEFATDPSALLGTTWRLVSMDGESMGDEFPLTLAFYSDSVLGGHAGCRDYLATYQASGDDLSLLFEIMFDVDCHVADAGLDREAQFLGTMAPKADLRLGTEQLELYGERGGVLVFEPLPEADHLALEGPTWSLLAFIGPNPYVEEPGPQPMPQGLLAGTTINLTFAAGTAQGATGCNRYEAAYFHAGSSLSFADITITEMACLDPAGVMEQEAHYLELLATVTKCQSYGDRLWLESSDGQALVFFAGGQ